MDKVIATTLLSKPKPSNLIDRAVIGIQKIIGTTIKTHYNDNIHILPDVSRSMNYAFPIEGKEEFFSTSERKRWVLCRYDEALFVLFANDIRKGTKTIDVYDITGHKTGAIQEGKGTVFLSHGKPCDVRTTQAILRDYAHESLPWTCNIGPIELMTTRKSKVLSKQNGERDKREQETMQSDKKSLETTLKRIAEQQQSIAASNF